MRPSTLKRLERFNIALDLLRKALRRSREEYLENIELQSIVERNIQVGVEFVVDLSSYILSRLNIPTPETYGQVIVEAHKLGIFDDEIAEKMRKLIGLRNIIVHLYADISSEIVYDNLPEIIGVLSRAVNELIAFSRRRGLDP